MSDSNTPLLIGMFSFLVGDDVALVFKDGAGEATVIIGSAQRALKVSKQCADLFVAEGPGGDIDIIVIVVPADLVVVAEGPRGGDIDIVVVAFHVCWVLLVHG